MADGGRAKASVHHDSQSNGDAGGGEGSEAVCFLGAQSKPRGFLTAGSSEFDSDKRLFRERGGEGVGTCCMGMGDRESGQDVGLEDGALNGTKHYLAP